MKKIHIEPIEDTKKNAQIVLIKDKKFNIFNLQMKIECP